MDAWRICVAIMVIWGNEALHSSARHQRRNVGLTTKLRLLHSGRDFKIHLGHTRIQDEPITFDLTNDATHRRVHNQRWEDQRGHENNYMTGLNRQGYFGLARPQAGRDFKIHLGHTSVQDLPITYHITNDDTHKSVHNQRWEDRRGHEDMNKRRNFYRTGQYY